jgi:deoxyribodipyrimidine photolyase-like uncharacterized protein
MIGAAGEARHVWSHHTCIAIFLAAMRHFRDALRALGWPCCSLALDQPSLPDSLGERLAWAPTGLQPQELRLCEPGEWRVLALVQEAAGAVEVPIRIEFAQHFMCSPQEFARSGRRQGRAAHGAVLPRDAAPPPRADGGERAGRRAPRTAMMVRNLARLSVGERDAIRQEAPCMLSHLDTL